ncbi:helix-turn-helix domain-containing protein [Serratia sp. AKBS12]|uniref:winged helix-turn-helix domain-containing protein n=1 Tax=Serratia sp. AKBS12 TaxID=2974597 RepID=UPI0021667EDE|nr:helix-turn-helix domain-containing protein [Serratia sp. AKBS12]MCS3407108.1 helix-turn-helix domain-containing protein [Serratia sp. AKBS12]HEI8868871.1 helix-turn-helix domain-containing protein [Serratia odorifera]
MQKEERKTVYLTAQVIFIPDLSCLKNKVTGQEIYLTPSEKKLLEIVAEGEGSKENIIHEIWRKNGIVVGESSYHQLIKMLRRKLAAADIPCTIIKTIPRYGVVLMKVDDSLQPGKIEADECQSSDSVCSDNDTDSIKPRPEPTPRAEIFEVERIDASEVKKTKPPKILLIFILIYTVLVPVFIWGVNEDVTNFSALTIDGVKFHVLNPEQMTNESLVAIRKRIGGDVNYVYVVDNGPKIWMAKCNKEIENEDSQCQYEHYSSY